MLILNLEDILSQQSSIVGDMGLWTLQSPEGIIFSELPDRSTVNSEHKMEGREESLTMLKLLKKHTTKSFGNCCLLGLKKFKPSALASENLRS